MKPRQRLALIVLTGLMIVPEADAIYGVRRRTHRRTAVIVGSAASASAAASVSAAQQQAAAAEAEAEAAAAKQQAAAAPAPTVAPAPVAAPAPAGAPATAGKPLPIGTVVPALPPGCVATPVGGVQYYYGGGNFYRAVFQGNQLVYVTAQPK